MVQGLTLCADGRRIGYAQNGEDIVLLRCFQDQSAGIWVDVGANHPVNDSVTKNFSDIGWTGINIEPVVSFHAALVEQRPHDVNLLAAVSDETGEMIFHQNQSNLDLSTFDDDLAARYRQQGDDVIDVEVPVVRLDTVCAEYLEGAVIDFLKVDTEGHELSVLRSHDFQQFPTRVVVAEATPERLSGITGLLAERDMRFVTFDGLNAWFVASAEFDALAPRIAQPPSPVLDWYHPAVYLRAMDQQAKQIEILSAQLQAAEVPAPVAAPRLLDRLRSRLAKKGGPE